MAKKRYSREFKEQVVKEYVETGDAAVVAKRHGVTSQSIYMWKSQLDRLTPATERENLIKQLQKQIKEKDLELQIFREIVKKTSLVMDSGMRLPKNFASDIPSI